METVLQRLVRALPVGSAMLMLAACGGASMPTAAGPVATSAKATAPATASEQSASALVRGVVVDSSNQPVAKANVECMAANVQCMGAGTQVIARDGPDSGVKTDANGSYALVVVASGDISGGVLLNANAKGYQVEFHQLSFPDAGCTSDQAACTVTLNFTLTAQPE